MMDASWNSITMFASLLSPYSRFCKVINHSAAHTHSLSHTHTQMKDSQGIKDVGRDSDAEECEMVKCAQMVLSHQTVEVQNKRGAEDHTFAQLASYTQAVAHTSVLCNGKI